MKTRKKTTIRTKFIILATIVVAAFLFLFSAFLFSIKSTHNYRQYNKSINEIYVRFLKLKNEQALFFLDVANPESSGNIAENRHLQNIGHLQQTLTEQIEQTGNSEIAQEHHLQQQIENLKNTIEAHSKNFDEIRHKAQTIGNSQSGLVLEVNENLQSLINQTASGELKEELQDLKITTNQYMNNPSMVHFEAFNSKVASLKQLGNASDTIETAATINVNQLAVVQELFNQYVALQKEIGGNTDEGLRQKLAVNNRAFEGEINYLREIVLNLQEDETERLAFAIILLLAFFIITIPLIIIRFSVILIRPVKVLKASIESLSRGELPEKKTVVHTKDEINEMNEAVNQLIEGLKKTTAFALEIGDGNYESDYEPLSENDKLGNSLLEMRNNLRKAQKEDEQRKFEDKQRNWVTEGLAKFGEILRQNNNDLEKLAYEITTKIVRYLNANQGALFVIDDSDENDIHIRQLSAFAYDRQRKAEKRIELEEGLIGRCIDESETIYMTEIPESYIEITSGLGYHNPRSLLIVPLKMNEEIFGAIELASFNAFEKFQIEFVEKIGESIASTISTAKINARTKELLLESKKQSEAMASQEEELRQNLEELQATQETLDLKDKQQKEEIERLNRENEQKLAEMEAVQNEIKAKEAEMRGVLTAINTSAMVTEYDMQGRIINVNNQVLEVLELRREDIVGKFQNEFSEAETVNIDDYREFWQKLRNGENQSKVHEIRMNGKSYWLSETYTTVFDSEGNPVKVINISEDITPIKQQELELESLLAEAREKEQQLVAQEEEMRQNMEELKTTQEEMERKQKAVEQTNRQLEKSENILRKALREAKEKEEQLKLKSEELAENEEELRQNMEELKATQEEMERKNANLLKQNARMKSSENILRKAVQETNETKTELQTALKREKELLARIAELEKNQQ